jgi:NAD(P)-dependent dehydrogenase (short-subunit alcohol dehydrogenase family)
MDLQGKVALVTGGTKGIGASTAILLAAEGADVAIVGRHVDSEALGVKAAIEGSGRRCVILQHDLAIAEEAARCVQGTREQLGDVDVLVHAAGGGSKGNILECPPEEWHAMFDVHVHAAYYLCREAAPMMVAKKEGAIVLISSVAGIRGIKFALAYGSAKGAVAHLTRMLAYQLADHNVRVNAVAPGIIRTAFHADMTQETYQHNVDNRIPLHREGTPQQVAEAILALVKNEYITGEILVVDGGLTSRIA